MSGEGPFCFVCGQRLIAGNNVLRVKRAIDPEVKWAHPHCGVWSRTSALLHELGAVQRGRLAIDTTFSLNAVTGDAGS